MLRLICSVSRYITPSRFSLLPLFLANLRTIAERLQMANQVVLRIDVISSFLRMKSLVYTLNEEALTAFLQATDGLSIGNLFEFVLELDIRFSAKMTGATNALQGCENLWTQLKKQVLDKIPKKMLSCPIGSLAEAIVCVRATKDAQPVDVDAVAKKAEVSLKDHLIPKTMVGFFLIRQKLYRPAERILNSCFTTLARNEHSSQLALYILTSELVNCRNRLGMYGAGSDIAKSVLNRPSSAKESISYSLSLRIAYSDSLVGQGMFERAESLLQELLFSTSQSALFIMCSLRLSKLRRRNGCNDQATDDTSYLWQAVRMLDLSTSFLGTYIVEEVCASVSLDEFDNLEAMRLKRELLDLCEEKIERISELEEYTNMKATLSAFKDRLLHRFKIMETPAVRSPASRHQF